MIRQLTASRVTQAQALELENALKPLGWVFNEGVEWNKDPDNLTLHFWMEDDAEEKERG